MHPNEELIRRFQEAQSKGDAAVLMELLADNIVWHVPGKNLLSRDYNGKGEVAGFWSKARELSDATVRAELLDVLASDGHAIALVRVTRSARGETWAGSSRRSPIASRTARSRSSGSWSRTATRSTPFGRERGAH